MKAPLRFTCGKKKNSWRTKGKNGYCAPISITGKNPRLKNCGEKKERIRGGYFQERRPLHPLQEEKTLASTGGKTKGGRNRNTHVWTQRSWKEVTQKSSKSHLRHTGSGLDSYIENRGQRPGTGKACLVEGNKN